MSQRVFVRNLGGTPIVLDVAESSDGVTDGDKGDITVSGGGTVWTIDSDVIRRKLTANRTYFVRTDGSDSNDGLANTAGGAFLTIQKALNVASTLDFAGFQVTISVADGTYTGANTFKLCVGSAAVTDLIVQGNTTTPANVVINVTGDNCFTASGVGVGGYITGFKLTSTINGLGLAQTAFLRVGKMDFGACSGAHIVAGSASSFTFNENYTISGGAQNHFVMQGNAYCTGTSATTVTLTGTPAFSNAFVNASGAGSSIEIFVTYSGAASAGTKRYDASLTAVINTFGGGAAFFPGGVAGTTASGAQYV